MRIYAAADLHGKSERIAIVEHHVNAQRPDLVVLAGDISRRGRPELALAALNRLDVPVWFVRGNSDAPRMEQLLARYPGVHSLHLTRRHWDGIGFVGIGGTLPLPFNSRLGLRQADTVREAEALLTPGSVLVAHPPPHGILDLAFGRFHSGSRALRGIMARCPAAMVICGHIHEQAGVQMADGTTVVNCTMGAGGVGVLIDYDGTAAPRCSFL